MTRDMEILLNSCHAEADNRVAKLVAADKADEENLPQLARLLRWLGESSVEVVATGSRSYSTPKATSDWDWVVLTDDNIWFKNNADSREFKTGLLSLLTSLILPWRRRREPLYNEEDTKTPTTHLLDGAYRFGPVNVIWVTSIEQLQVWRTGTALLMTEAPVPRERAVQVFSALKAEVLDG